MDPDGQTHWMTRCDENADCGELSCICGVCTETCTASDECSIGEGSEASCQRTDSVLDTTACTLAQAAARVCVPRCEAQRDCNGVASDLTCTSDDVCAVDDHQVIDTDGSVPVDQDATIEEQAPPVTGPVTPIELACDEDGNLDGTGTFEVVVSGDFGGALAIASSGTIFSTGLLDTYNSAFRVVDGEIEAFGMELWELQRIFIAGDELITGKSDGYEATVAATHLETQAKLTLAREDALNLKELTADDDAVYWVAQLGQDPVRSALWRSPRVPGESLLLAELDGYASELVVINDDLFFFGSIDGNYDLIRIAKDGSSGSALEANEVPQNAGRLRTDGQHLFFALHDEMDDLGNPIPGDRGIVRMDPVTLDYEMVLSSGEDQPAQMIVGGPYVYWTTDHTTQDFEPILKLWRGAKSGSGAPQQLGTIEAYTDTFAEHDGQLYWISTCRIGNDGTIKSHIVRTTD
jgi:hypothetical protein